jgi:nucleotide-binding universal stress UspA family protein
MENRPARILCCTDFSANALDAFDAAVEAASRRPGSQLHLLHVLPEPEVQFWRSYIYQADFNIDEQARKDIEERIAAEYRPRIPAWLKFIFEYRIGRDYEQILSYASEIDADFMVIGRQGSSSKTLRSFFFGNVAERVVSRANCPVLVVPVRK